MKRTSATIIITAFLLCLSLQQQAQVLEVSVFNVGGNKIQIIGMPTGAGFTTAPSNSWASMNLTWRIPKSAAIPPPTVAPPPAPTPEVIDEGTDFTGAEPRNTFNGEMDLTIFDLTTFGLPDDDYWYFQVTGTIEGVQNMVASSTNILYEFTVPWQWLCTGCVEILTTPTDGLPISTVSFIDNAAHGDVLLLVQNNAPLPVEFISFDARKEQQQVQLNWRVSSEENIKTYHVERSADGVNYTSIGSVAPKPAATVNDYAFTDASPLNGLNYYRIREEDRDGKAMYSVVRLVKMDGSAFIVSMYPVPVKDELTVKLVTDTDEPVYIRITDVQGRTIFLRKMQLNAGNNIQKLPVQNLMNGMYFIDVTGTGKKWSGKFIKE